MQYNIVSVNDAELFLKRGDFLSCFNLCRDELIKSPGDALLLTVLTRVIHLSPCVVDSWQDVNSILKRFLDYCGQEGIQTLSLWQPISLLNSHLMRNLQPEKGDITDFLSNNSVVHNSEIIKLVILTCVWKRHDLSRLFFAYYNDLKEKLSLELDIQIVAVGSEGDISRTICEKYGAYYLEYANQPLSAKWQAGLDFTRSLDFDALVVLGSDDFICDKTLKLYARKIADGALFFGFQDCYIHNYSSQQTIYWKGYGASNEPQSQPHRVGETIGLGRLLRRELLDYMGFDLWGGISVNKSLDGIMKNKIIKKTGFLPVKPHHGIGVVINDRNYIYGMLSSRLEDEDLFGVDVKISDNVTSFDKYITSPDVYEEVTSALSDSDQLFFLNKL